MTLSIEDDQPDAGDHQGDGGDLPSVRAYAPPLEVRTEHDEVEVDARWGKALLRGRAKVRRDIAPLIAFVTVAGTALVAVLLMVAVCKWCGAGGWIALLAGAAVGALVFAVGFRTCLGCDLRNRKMPL